MEHSRQPTAIVKIGTDVMTDGKGCLNEQKMGDIIDQIMEVRSAGYRVLLVTSGAVATGRTDYKRKGESDETMNKKGMYASSGQPLLMYKYHKLLKKYGCSANQFLVTRELFESQRSKTMLGRLEEIFHDERPGLPIFNENDALADDEMRCTDNDELAGLLAEAVHAQVLFLLTNVDGLYRNLENPTSLMRNIPYGMSEEELQKFVSKRKSANGSGGMPSKITVGCKLRALGIKTWIVNGTKPRIMPRVLLHSEREGTEFALPEPARVCIERPVKDR